MLKDYIPENNNDMCDVRVTRSASIAVPVTSPCDQYWRDIYPDNWMWQANRAVTRADDELTDRYGIYYYSVSQKYWDSESTSPEALVSEVRNEWGLRDGAQLMIAFTGCDLGDTAGIELMKFMQDMLLLQITDLIGTLRPYNMKQVIVMVYIIAREIQIANLQALVDTVCKLEAGQQKSSWSFLRCKRNAL